MRWSHERESFSTHVEGEKDVDNLALISVLATCNAGGAEKWTFRHAEFLRDRDVIVVSDNDEAGRRHVQQVAQSLLGIAKSVRIVELPMYFVDCLRQIFIAFVSFRAPNKTSGRYGNISDSRRV